MLRLAPLALILAAVGPRPSIAADLKLLATGAFLFDEPLTHLEMVELRGQPSRHLTLGAAVAHASSEGVLQEMQFRAHVSFSVKAGAWEFESRHLLSHGSQTELRYRHRLRAVRAGLSGSPALSLRAYDEYFADLDGRGSLRNVLTAGAGIALGQSGLAEIYHAWSEERFVRDTRYWLLVLTWRLN